MRGVYTSAFKCAAWSAAGTLAYLTAPSGKVVEIIGITVTNESNANNFQMEIRIANISSLGTPTATSVTPTPHEAGDQAAGSTTKFAVTASAPSYGTTITQEGAASLVGYRHEPAPEERIYVSNGNSIGIEFITTPGAATDFDVRITFREIG